MPQGRQKRYDMESLAVIIEAPERLSLRPLRLEMIGTDDVLIDTAWSGVSTGTEKLLWTGEMPPFPGMGYPLVPGYESVGRIVEAGKNAQSRIGEWVFVPGARCYVGAHGLFGGNSQRLIVPAARAITVPEALEERGVLLALAATALHLLKGGTAPELIVGHGVLGRLIARIAIARGARPPLVWENNPIRRAGAQGYEVRDPADDEHTACAAICDVSGNASLIEPLIKRLARGGEVVLGGFYRAPISFAFPPAFQREARLRIAAEWQPEDLSEVRDMVVGGLLDLSGLVSDVRPAEEAGEAYPYAFTDSRCLKLVLDWRMNS